MTSIPTGYSRRSFLAGAGGLALFALTGCGADKVGTTGGGATASSGPWEFTDDRGIKITRPGTPKNVVAYVSSAAALWDFGFQVIGAFGPQRTADGKRELQAGNIDIAKVTPVGNAWDDFNVDKALGLKPDLFITGLTGAGNTDLWVIDEELGPKLDKIAPTLAVSEYQKGLPVVIERYRELAKALGADVEAAGIATAKADFERASEELRTAAKEKAGLKVAVLYGGQDGIYMAKPEFFSDLIYYRELGLDIVTPGGTEDYWEQLSWEQVDKYPADLILTDTRTYALSQAQMAEFPTWRNLPAYKADQIGDWSAEPRFNYHLATPVIKALTEKVRSARVDVVA